MIVNRIVDTLTCKLHGHYNLVESYNSDTHTIILKCERCDTTKRVQYAPPVDRSGIVNDTNKTGA